MRGHPRRTPQVGNVHGALPEACGCGAYPGRGGGGVPTSPRLLHFWNCPVPQAAAGVTKLHLTAGPVP